MGAHCDNSTGSLLGSQIFLNLVELGKVGICENQQIGEKFLT